MTLPSLPNLPDNFHKFIVTIGILLLAYSYYEDMELTNKYNQEIDKYSMEVQEANYNLIRNSFKLEQIIKKANYLAAEKGIPEIITTKDSLVIFNQIIKGPVSLKGPSDSIAKMWDEYKIEELDSKINKERLVYSTERIDDLEMFFNSDQIGNRTLYVTACILIIIGIYNWQRQQNINDKLQKFQLDQIPTKHDYCQSCGRNFSPMRPYGKNIDGALNYTFCVECYDNGIFNDSFTITELTDLKNQALKGAKSIKIKSKINNRFKNLLRWNYDEFN